MKLTEQLQLLDRIHSLIRRKGTGTPDELAQRLVYNHINALKELGAEISYCKTGKVITTLSRLSLTSIR